MSDINTRGGQADHDRASGSSGEGEDSRCELGITSVSNGGNTNTGGLSQAAITYGPTPGPVTVTATRMDGTGLSVAFSLSSSIVQRAVARTSRDTVQRALDDLLDRHSKNGPIAVQYRTKVVAAARAQSLTR